MEEEVDDGGYEGSGNGREFDVNVHMITLGCLKNDSRHGSLRMLPAS
jgi:hypothetical protein